MKTSKNIVAAAVLGVSALATAAVITAGLLSADEVEAQATEITPLYSGLDSVGGDPKPQPNEPALFFEAKAHWPSLGIAEPRTAWELAQRGMYKQDDLEDLAGAIEDYEAADVLDHRLLIVHGRLGTIHYKRGLQMIKDGNTTGGLAELDECLESFAFILVEQPYRQGMHLRRAEAYLARYGVTNDPADVQAFEAECREELKLNPINTRCMYDMAFVFRDLGRTAEARAAAQSYLREAERHGDPYPIRILRCKSF